MYSIVMDSNIFHFDIIGSRVEACGHVIPHSLWTHVLMIAHLIPVQPPYTHHNLFLLDIMEGTSTRRHNRMRGYEACIHTCGCKNQVGLHVWRREGAGCVRHAKSRVMHPRCTRECPGYRGLSKGRCREDFTRNLNREEILQSLPAIEVDQELIRLRLEPTTKKEKADLNIW